MEYEIIEDQSTCVLIRIKELAGRDAVALGALEECMRYTLDQVSRE